MPTFFPLIALVLVFGYPLVLLRPFTRLIKDNPQPTSNRFSMTDLLSLTALVPLPMAVLNSDGRLGTTGAVIGMMVGATIWLAGLTAFNQIGVENQWKRVVGMGFTFPLALAGGFCLPMVIVLFFEAVTGTSRLSLTWTTIGTLSYFGSTFFVWSSAKWVVTDRNIERIAPEKQQA